MLLWYTRRKVNNKFMVTPCISPWDGKGPVIVRTQVEEITSQRVGTVLRFLCHRKLGMLNFSQSTFSKTLTTVTKNQAHKHAQKIVFSFQNCLSVCVIFLQINFLHTAWTHARMDTHAYTQWKETERSKEKQLETTQHVLVPPTIDTPRDHPLLALSILCENGAQVTGRFLTEAPASPFPFVYSSWFLYLQRKCWRRSKDDGT